MGKHRTLEEKIEIIRFKEQGHSISQARKGIRDLAFNSQRILQEQRRNPCKVLCWHEEAGWQLRHGRCGGHPGGADV